MKKKLKITVLAGAIAFVAAVGGTMAYFSQQTEKKTNVFTMGNSIVGELKEPQWDHDPFTGDKAPTGTPGKEMAENFYPDMTIPKNPAIKNLSNGTDAWVAIKLTYKKGTDSVAFSELDKFIDIQFNTTDWIISDDYSTAYYKQALPADQVTNAVFENVHIDKLAISAEQFAAGAYTEALYPNKNAKDYVISDFEIEAKGYLVQTSGFNNATEAMTSAFEGIFGK